MRAGLQDELDARREQWQAGTTPERRALYEAQIEELRASGLVAQALAVGSLAAGFSLPDARGGSFALSDALSRGPVVLVFYRGGWCPYCNIALKAYQRVLPEINALGAELVAISPERPDLSLSTAEKNDLAFAALSDTGNRVADAFRAGLSAADRSGTKAYASNGIDLAAINAADEWRLPVPATFIIAATGRVTLAHIEVDYRRRLDPDAVLAALRFPDKGMVA